jgi:hypothetical protein
LILFATLNFPGCFLIAVDFWLEDHFAEAQQDPEVEDFVQTSTPVIDLVHVTSEHPTYDFQVGDQEIWLIPEEI